MILIDTFPTNSIKGLEYRVGRVFPFGATIESDGAVNFSVYSKEATGCTLVLFHHGSKKPWVEIPFPEAFRIGNVYTMMVYGINTETTEYGYRFDGPCVPEKGLLFDNSRILLDPYARSVSGRSVWGRKPDYSDIFSHRGQIIREDYIWEGDKPLEIRQCDLVIYEMHVRSFTAHKSSESKYPGTFAGITGKIPYLKELGVNCVELMPVFEFDEFENAREKDGKQLLNCWGYSTVAFFAPKAGYAVSAAFGMEADELKGMIKRLHQNGIEVILDVVFNHTAEGNENGPCISYRGIDNRTYYLLTPDGFYYNFSGCGNTMNCNDPVVRNMVLDCLRYWVSAYHVDGFRFDLASILTRDEAGSPMINPPLLDSIAHDAVLGKSILIAEAWDAGGLYQVGSFPSWRRWSEWNGRYRDCLRRFIKGGAECAPELYHRIKGSDDMYAGRSAAASVNFVTCHDGFTLYDLVSYNEKHNEDNGENNLDGSDSNDSWNCGAEGETDDAGILELRFRQMRNMLTILLTSRGIPMLLSGDEFANTQWGNNNAYCQDNEISWLDWSLLNKNKELFDFVKHLIAFRVSHPVIKGSKYDFGRNATGYPELSFHGTEPWSLDETAPSLVFAYMYAEEHEKYGTKKDCFIYVAVNAHWEEHSFKLPVVPEGFKWYLAFEAYGVSSEPGKEKKLPGQVEFLLGPRSTAVLMAEKG
ncbi:MAG: glycogen debranching protein GlgX [Lachnospiraceae bacterium]|nr:glycogen debranching protein GlgX [Lachnospiraceae bacterium]